VLFLGKKALESTVLGQKRLKMLKNDALLAAAYMSLASH
jgi:hypothetical protein